MSRECDVRVREHGGYDVVVDPAYIGNHQPGKATPPAGHMHAGHIATHRHKGIRHTLDYQIFSCAPLREYLA